MYVEGCVLPTEHLLYQWEAYELVAEKKGEDILIFTDIRSLKGRRDIVFNPLSELG